MVSWGLGLGKRCELFRPCRASSVAQPLFLSAMRASFDQEREWRAVARRFQSEAHLHFLAVASHVICAFSQADLLVGALSAAKAGATKATARPRVMMETSVFIEGSPCMDSTSR